MRKLQNRLLPEYRRIAEQFGITPEEVQEIEAFQWKFVKENMAKGHDDFDTFENIYLRFLGTFHASKDMVKYIVSNKKKKDAKDTGDI